MKNQTPVSIVESLNLPFDPPRDAWPDLIDLAARSLRGESVMRPEHLAFDLLAIAGALRAEVSA